LDEINYQSKDKKLNKDNSGLKSKKSVLDFLYVDDDDTLRETFKDYLEDLCDIETSMVASSALEARGILKDYNVKVILSDANMPEEDGLSLLSYILRAEPRTKRLLLTGRIDHEVFERAQKDGLIHGYFTKPFKIKEIISLVESYIENSEIS